MNSFLLQLASKQKQRLFSHLFFADGKMQIAAMQTLTYVGRPFSCNIDSVKLRLTHIINFVEPF